MHHANRNEIKIFCPEDCGNAPKKRLIQQFTIAMAGNDFAFVKEQLADDVVWNIVGKQKTVGREPFLESLRQTWKTGNVLEIHLDNIITHGRTGAANGFMRLDNGQHSFCDVYLFNSAGKNAKIKQLTSYVILE